MVHYDTEFLVSNGDASPAALFPVSSDANAKGNTTEIPHLAGLRNYQPVVGFAIAGPLPYKPDHKSTGDFLAGDLDRLRSRILKAFKEGIPDKLFPQSSSFKWLIGRHIQGAVFLSIAQRWKTGTPEISYHLSR